MLEWPAWVAYQEEIAARKQERVAVAAPATGGEKAADPVEVMAAAEHTFNAQIETQMRKRLQEASTKFFEKAVIELIFRLRVRS